jgi:RHS repeat-associated protein
VGSRQSCRLAAERRDRNADAVVNAPGEYATTYTLDPAGNRLGRVTDDHDPAKDESVIYSYLLPAGTLAVDDLLQSEQSTLTGSTPPATTTTAYGYDLNGSLTTKTVTAAGGGVASTTTYAWDLRGRMLSATSAGVTTRYEYDADGQRVRRQVGPAVTRYVVDADNPTGYAKAIEERDAAGQVVRGVVFGHAVLAERGGTLADPVEHHLRDARGFTRGLFNASGGPLAGQSFDFDAFGNPLDPGVTPATDWLAPDGRTDAETGFTYHLARYANRSTGRWISRDPTIFPPGQLADANLSLFISHSPVMGSDPTGRFFSLGEFSIASTIRNQLAAAYSGAFKGALYSVHSVQQGLTVNQALAGFVLDELLGPIDEVVERASLLYDLLHRGTIWIASSTGLVQTQSVDAPSTQSAGVGAGALLGLYRRIRRPGTIYQAHHLNQRAVWGGIIDDNGASISLGFRQHEDVHAHMRAVYARHRLAGTSPTVAEYNAEMSKALRNAGKSATVIRQAMSLMRAEQRLAGFLPTSFIPRLPLR